MRTEFSFIGCGNSVIQHNLYFFCLSVHRFGVDIVIDAEFQDADYDLQSQRMIEIKEEVPQSLKVF